jgi:methylglutaconyl-CoA hydratase
MASFTRLALTRENGLATVSLNRPELHNAFDPAMIDELTSCFNDLAADSSVRIVVLTGAGRSFCAGADLQWMRDSLAWSYDENLADAERLTAMYETIDSLPKPLVGRINGPAIGGGAGLVACCDIAIAVEGATFGFTEVKLGLLPAVIARYVVSKIGSGHARALFVTGARFDAGRALSLGLVHRVVPAGDLDTAVQATVDELWTSGPLAAADAKALLAVLARLTEGERRAYTVAAIAAARTGAEGQAGLAAFLDKRSPPWSER